MRARGSEGRREAERACATHPYDWSFATLGKDLGGKSEAGSPRRKVLVAAGFIYPELRASI